MKTDKKRKGKPGAGLLASLMNKAGVSPFGDAKYLRGFSLTCQERLKAVSGSEFMTRGAIVSTMEQISDDDRAANKLYNVVNRICNFGDHLETFWLDDAGQIVRKPASKYEGPADPVSHSFFQNSRATGLMDKIACIVIPGQVFAEVRMNFGPYVFIGTVVPDSKHLEFVRISLPVVQDKAVLDWFRQLYGTYDKVVF